MLQNQEAPKDLVGSFVEHVIEEDGEMDEELTLEFFKSDVSLQALIDIFANTVKSLKCSECSHLILLPKLP